MKKNDFIKNGIEVFRTQKPNVIAYMPIIVGKLFLELPELSSRLHYKMPVENGSLLTRIAGYIALMNKYVQAEEFILAMECYKFALSDTIEISDTLNQLGESAIVGRIGKAKKSIKVAHDDLILKETLKRFPNFKINQQKYKKSLKMELGKNKADKEILDSKFLEEYIKTHEAEVIFGG